jgi:hypothetical protein
MSYEPDRGGAKRGEGRAKLNFTTFLGFFLLFLLEWVGKRIMAKCKKR